MDVHHFVGDAAADFRCALETDSAILADWLSFDACDAWLQPGRLARLYCPRLLVEDVVVFGLTDAQTPSRTQITLLERDDLTAFTPGVWVSVFAQIGPPGSPVEPGGFDYRRTVWFDGLEQSASPEGQLLS